MSLNKNSLTESQKQAVIAKAMESEEGKTILAQSMVEPIRRSLEFQAVGRKLLMVDDLPQGALARYERDVAATAHRLPRRGAVPDQIIEGDEVLVPTFEIAAYPTIKLSEIQARRFFIVDRAQIKAKEAIQKEEDDNIFSTLNAAVESSGQIVAAPGSGLDPASLNEAFRMIEQHSLVAVRIVMHPNQYAAVRQFGHDFFDQATVREVITTGLYGHLWTADIHVSTRILPNQVLVVSTPETVGAFPIRQDITVLPADDPRKLRLGWVIYEEVGVFVANDYSISRIDV